MMSTSTPVVYTFDEWLEQFDLVYNHVDDRNGFNGHLFETFGKEFDYVASVAGKNLVWTLIEEDGEQFIVNGLRTVNRLGFFVTENNYAENEIVLVTLGEN